MTNKYVSCSRNNSNAGKASITILTIEYSFDDLETPEFRSTLRSEMLDCYRSHKQRLDLSCVVDIHSEVVVSAVNRALFALWRDVVERNKGQLYCVGYPSDYVDGLAAVGMLALEGFFIAETIEGAVQRIRGHG